MALHSFTPQLRVIDPRGLPAREVAWHRIDQAAQAQARVTRHVWDEAGCLVAEWDPRLGNMAATANSRKIPSLSGQKLLDESVDAGWRLALSGADGQSVERWDGRGSHSRTDCDECLRPVSVTEQDADAAPNVVERYTYGDTSTLCAERNQCGRLIRHDDPAGTWRAHEFGLTGGVLIENRRFLQTDAPPDWPLGTEQRDALLEPGTGHTTTRVFDATASLMSQTNAVGNRTEYLNTVGGFLREIRLKLADAHTFQTLISDLHYNPDGQVESERLGNGVITEKTYEPESGGLTRIFSSKADSTLLQDLNHRYDPVGNIVEIEDTAQPVRFFANQRIDPVSRYRYDTLYQLIEATGREVSSGTSHGPALPTLQNLPQDPNQLSNYTQSYDYDTGGNLLEMRHVGAQSFTRKMLIAPDSNRSLPEGDVDLNFDEGFDANGNLQQLIRGQDLTWDLRNQLRSVSGVERETSGNDEERYVYDGSGQRCRKICTALAKSRTLVGEVRYLPGLELRTEVTGEALQISVLQTGRNNVRVLHWPGGKSEGIANNQIRYTLNDHMGSSALELEDKGELISQENYYPFGGTSWWAARSSIEAKYKTIRYSGKERDASGLYYYGFRYYAPWLQRWLNPDPQRDIDGLNVFRFVRDNPFTLIDVSGNFGETPQAAALRERLMEVVDQSPSAYDAITSLYEHDISEHSILSNYKRAGYTGSEYDHFENQFFPHEWRFQYNFKYRDTGHPTTHANEIALAQYTIIAERQGFFGQLPSLIKRTHISNEGVKAVAQRWKHDPDRLKTAFFTETQNGKSTARILSDFGLQAWKVEAQTDRFNDLTILIHVNHEGQQPLAARPPSRFSVCAVREPARCAVTPVETNASQPQTVARSRFRVSIVHADGKSHDTKRQPITRLSPFGQGR